MAMVRSGRVHAPGVASFWVHGPSHTAQAAAGG